MKGHNFDAIQLVYVRNWLYARIFVIYLSRYCCTSAVIWNTIPNSSYIQCYTSNRTNWNLCFDLFLLSVQMIVSLTIYYFNSLFKVIPCFGFILSLAILFIPLLKFIDRFCARQQTYIDGCLFVCGILCRCV